MEISIQGHSGKTYAYNKRDVLGHGSYATVYKGYNSSTKEAVAIKVLGDVRFLNNKSPQKYMEVAKREIAALEQVGESPFIIKMVDHAFGQDFSYIITEFCDGGALRNKLKKSHIQESKALGYLCDLANALKVLHSKNIMHRDINLQNILLSNNQCKLADFGSALKQKTCNRDTGTPTYQAPEIIQLRKEPWTEYTNQVDIWSAGVVFFKMLFGRKLYREFQEKIEKDLLGKKRFPNNFDVSERSLKILDKMLRADPGERITAEALVEYLKREIDESDESEEESEKEDLKEIKTKELIKKRDIKKESKDPIKEKNKEGENKKANTSLSNKNKGKSRSSKKTKKSNTQTNVKEEDGEVVPIEKKFKGKLFDLRYISIFVVFFLLGMYSLSHLIMR